MCAFFDLRRFCLTVVLAVFGVCLPVFSQATSNDKGITSNVMRLQTGWQIQSSCKVAEKGDVLSAASFKPRQWYRASVPGAVVANLVADHVKEYPDPYTAMYLRKMPGVSYPIG